MKLIRIREAIIRLYTSFQSKMIRSHVREIEILHRKHYWIKKYFRIESTTYLECPLGKCPHSSIIFPTTALKKVRWQIQPFASGAQG